MTFHPAENRYGKNAEPPCGVQRFSPAAAHMGTEVRSRPPFSVPLCDHFALELV